MTIPLKRDDLSDIKRAVEVMLFGPACVGLSFQLWVLRLLRRPAGGDS